MKCNSGYVPRLSTVRSRSGPAELCGPRTRTSGPGPANSGPGPGPVLDLDLGPVQVRSRSGPGHGLFFRNFYQFLQSRNIFFLFSFNFSLLFSNICQCIICHCHRDMFLDWKATLFPLTSQPPYVGGETWRGDGCDEKTSTTATTRFGNSRRWKRAQTTRLASFGSLVCFFLLSSLFSLLTNILSHIFLQFTIIRDRARQRRWIRPNRAQTTTDASFGHNSKFFLFLRFFLLLTTI
jgi:hypothetical protein